VPSDDVAAVVVAVGRPESAADTAAAATIAAAAWHRNVADYSDHYYLAMASLLLHTACPLAVDVAVAVGVAALDIAPVACWADEEIAVDCWRSCYCCCCRDVADDGDGRLAPV